MNEIGRHSRTSTYTHNLTYGSLIIQAIIIVGFVLFVGIKLCSQPGRQHPHHNPLEP